MLVFCPNCANMLVVTTTDSSEEYPAGRNAFACRTCPYQFIVDNVFYESREVVQKKAEDIISEADMWKGANETEVQCNNDECDNDRAFFYQRQIRSADEPMTTNFKCTKCGQEWREN